MARVYVETSIVSHAVSRPSRSAHLAYLQKQARDWWAIEKSKFEITTSTLVLSEASRGDPKLVEKRLALLEGSQILEIDEKTAALAERFVFEFLIPPKASNDAIHVAAAVFAKADFLLTLNCRHIANAHILPMVYRIIREQGLPAPIICTPAEFLGDLYETDDEQPDS